MTEFVGRTGARRVYSYPERPRGSELALLARNFAAGPSSATDIDIAPTPIPWNIVDVGGAGTTVPITPRSSGIILISGVISIKSTSGIQESVLVQVVVNGLPLLVPFLQNPTIEANGFISIPFLTELNLATFGSLLPVGVAAAVSILVTAANADTLQLAVDSSSMTIQEVRPATG